MFFLPKASLLGLWFLVVFLVYFLLFVLSLVVSTGQPVQVIAWKDLSVK